MSTNFHQKQKLVLDERCRFTLGHVEFEVTVENTGSSFLSHAQCHHPAKRKSVEFIQKTKAEKDDGLWDI